MRHSFICPKCSSSEVIVIAGSRLNQSAVIHLNRLGLTAILDRYVCTACAARRRKDKVGLRLTLKI